MTTKLDYEMLAFNYKAVLRYLVRYSDEFALITNLVKPYSKVPPNLEHADALSNISPDLTRQIVRVREWPYNRDAKPS